MSRMDDTDQPRAVVHKRILDIAEERPDASLTEIADDVGGATPDLVDQVLAEYGDPSEPADGDGAAPEPHPDEDTGAGNVDPGDADEPAAGNGGVTGDLPSVANLSERELATLRAVRDSPEATQADLAETLGVSRATVSRRLNDVPGFEWPERAAFVAELFDGYAHEGADPATVPRAETEAGGVDAPSASADGGTVAEPNASADGPEGRAWLSPDLAHKVVHACMESERLDEDEELRVIKAVLEGGAGRHD